MMAVSTLRWFLWALAALSIATACRKPRGWSLTPTTPTSLTMSALGYHVDVRVSIELPPNYQREPGGIASEADWRTPEGSGYEGRSPMLSLSIQGHDLLSDGCNLGKGQKPDTLSVQQVRPDLLVSRCGDLSTGRVDYVHAFHTMTLPAAYGIPRSISLWCTFIFHDEYESRDIDDAASICSSIRWHVLETEPPQSLDEPSSKQDASKPSP